MISIHALVKRATYEIPAVNKANMISIHALVKRATKTPILIKADQNISIHALVKRATLYYVHAQCNLHYFNPRPREEGDC